MGPKKKTSKTNLSLVSEFDDLCQKSQVFSEGGEKEFLAFLENAKEWRRQMVTSESEVQRLSKLLIDTEKELQSKDQKIKQARQMVNLEMRERQKIEQECEELQKQWGSLQNLVNSKVGIVNNDTLQRIRSSVSSSILNTPIGKGKKRDEMIAEYSQESILDASDLFEDSVENNQELEVRSGSGSRSRSGTTANKSIVTITTTTVDPNGHVHATAVLESQDLPEKVKTPIGNYGKRTLEIHDFQKKNAVLRERCGICDKKIKFGKSCLKCLECGLVCHPECKSEALAAFNCIRGQICTPENGLFTPLMASSAGNTVPVAKRTRAGTQDYFQSPMLKKNY